MKTTIINICGGVLDALKPPRCPLCGRRTPGTRRMAYHLVDVHGWLLNPQVA